MSGRIAFVLNLVLMLSTCQCDQLAHLTQQSATKDTRTASSEQALDAQVRAQHLRILQKQVKGLVPRLNAGGHQARSVHWRFMTSYCD